MELVKEICGDRLGYCHDGMKFVSDSPPWEFDVFHGGSSGSKHMYGELVTVFILGKMDLWNVEEEYSLNVFVGQPSISGNGLVGPTERRGRVVNGRIKR